MLSVTVALTVAVLLPVVNASEEPGANARAMDCTRQVVNCSGCDVTPPTLANMDEIPGMAAVATSWFSGAFGPGEDNETDEEVDVCPAAVVELHVNCPTLGVMSFVLEVPAYATASNNMLSGPEWFASLVKHVGLSVAGWPGTGWITTRVTCWCT